MKQINLCFLKKKHMPPILKTLTGTVYPSVVKGQGPAFKPLPRKRHEHDKSYYTEPQVMVNEHDLASWNNLRGVPLIFEHGAGQKEGDPVVFGHTVDTTVQSDNSVFYVAQIYDTPEGRWAAEKIECGIITGLSIGYGIIPDVTCTQIAGKRVTEVSMVLKPFFPTAQLRVCASDNDNYNGSDNKCVVDKLHLMDPQGVAPTPQDNGKPRDAAAEIAQAAADIQLKQARDAQLKAQEELERLRKEKEDQEKELTTYRKEKQAQLEAQAQSRVKEVDAALVNVQRALGVAALPEEFVNANRAIAQNTVFMPADAPAKQVAEVTASMTTLIGKRMGEMADEQAKKDKEIAELKARMQEMEAKLNMTADRVQASRNALYQTAKTENVKETVQSALSAALPVPDVQASRLHGSHITDILVVPMVKPGTVEGRMYQETNPNFGMMSPSSFMGVHASASVGTTEQTTVQVRRLPTHDRLEHVPHSLRNRKDEAGNPVGEAWMSQILFNYNPTAPCLPTFKIQQQPLVIERSK
jgi:hypothetical protein